MGVDAGGKPAMTAQPQQSKPPPRVVQAQRFLARRGWVRGQSRRPVQDEGGNEGSRNHNGSGLQMAGPKAEAQAHAQTQAQNGQTFVWQPLGPAAVISPNYGLITGRVSALALDPADATGNHLYIGTTGGGVWVAQNAAVSSAGEVVFTPLTDNLAALNGPVDPSISIGALTVQPGGTGVVLAGTGDPNDALDSYYGAGVLRSADGGNTWNLTQITADGQFSFVGEGFAGFAWSTVNPELVVAAVSQAYEGTLVNAVYPDRSFEGLYYSTDGGATWNLATITDGGSTAVQGPSSPAGLFDGNAATSVVWNPVRNLFIAAVRFHGYYQSSDGITFTRMAAQPGAGLTAALCPTNFGELGSLACPILRGTLAVNPLTGDTFAWTVDDSNQDQGLWQDQCTISGLACGAPSITFAQQWNTQALETSTSEGPATIANGDYNLALAAVPFALQPGADTWLLAGANDLWRCSLAQGCVWRNTTNATSCMSAQVAEFQHALAWSTGNPLEILLGNDSGLWRSLDAISETGPVCSASDAAHFQNLNGSLGSLAEIESLAASQSSQYNMMAGLGVNGTAGLKSATAATTDWPQILGGYGGPVAIDPRNPVNWYVNNQSGVAIYLCSDPSTCSSADFGTSPVITDADVGGDGNVMPSPAPFLVDPLDPTQLLIGTCRLWRGSASGVGWSGSNAVSPILDSGAVNVSCGGDALIRSIAAMPISGGEEVVYVGMYGALNGGQALPGHVLTATINPLSGTMPVWSDLTPDPVQNSPDSLNLYGLDISSIVIDSHDPTGNTVYVTVEGFTNPAEQVQTVYGSTDGGLDWNSLTANLPELPVNGLVVDPQSENTVYLATDFGVYFTTQVSSCADLPSTCWSAFGIGLPAAPVVGLSAPPATAAVQVLTAATYGRGVWQTPLWTTATTVTTATANPPSLTFASQVFGTTSNAQTVTLTNTGALALTPTGIAMTGDFSETDNCQDATVAANASCSIEVSFTPTATGALGGQMTISANVSGGQLTVSLSGTGAPAGVVTLTPSAISFDPSPSQVSNSPPVLVNTTSGLFPVSVGNSGGAAIPIASITITPPFTIATNSCGTASLAALTDCQMQLAFTPAQEGAVTGTLTIVDGAGTQTAML
ncbi:MAG: choice-of-anchor D domain-containing protein, partial [Terracidiphilus sp.]